MDQLEKAGVIARGGQIIAASIVKAPIQTTTRDDNAHIKTGDTVRPWSDAQRAQQDVQARWTCKHGKTSYGYTLHISADRRWGLIRFFLVMDSCVLG